MEYRSPSLSLLPLRRLLYVRKAVYPTVPREFLTAARADIVEDTPRGRANCLSNAKRAIANRVDTLIYSSGLGGFAKRGRWGLPRRMEGLREIGYSTPTSLHKAINKPRNLLEHDYAIPADRAELLRILDLAETYLLATDRYLERGIVRAVIYASSKSPKTSDLSNLRGDTVVALLDFDQDTVQWFSREGTSEPIPLAEIGEGLVIRWARARLSSIADQTAGTRVFASEAEFYANVH
jgi:hypothetical protein